MADGRMQVSDALSVARQVASALSAAHQAGIVHRDIKPENVMLRPDGYVKVLDFGLAKLTEGQAISVEGEPSARVPVKTDTGVVIGTVSYMSPEQAKGQRVDQRSDIFSFGVVLYEMLTGESLFRRDSDVETLHAIVYEQPAGLSGLRGRVPLALDRVLRRCLEKDPERRYNSGSELAEALEKVAASSGLSAALPGWALRVWPRSWRSAGATIAAIIVLTLVNKWIYFTSDRTGTDQVWKVPSQGGEAVQVTGTAGICPPSLPTANIFTILIEALVDFGECLFTVARKSKSGIHSTQN
ncbi:MAG TPA: protein kinase, partial [Blastocatellia bacterium]|nr:protein kinase [Blastocatellia bacterium]